MSMFVEYATLSDLAEYMGVKEEDLPKGTNIMLRRASELVGIAMRGNYKPEWDAHVESAKLATCAQCQNWIETNVSPVSNGDVASYSLGELSITYADVGKYSSKLCTMAVKYLNSVHLLYKGMR